MARNRRDGGGAYEVGYRKPPRHSRFRKGRSGNPKGRPRGSKNSATLLKQALGEHVIVTENGRRKTATKLEVIFKQLVNRAAQGDHRATQLLLNYYLPSVEARLEASATNGRSALPPPLSPPERQARERAIAKILLEVGYTGAASSANEAPSSGETSNSNDRNQEGEQDE